MPRTGPQSPDRCYSLYRRYFSVPTPCCALRGTIFNQSKVVMKISYIVASTEHGTLIVNRNDENSNEQYGVYGLGYNLLETGSFFKGDIDLLKDLVRIRKKRIAGKRPLSIIDCGANIGVHTVELARELADSGNVIAVEAQKHIFYALCGNVAINNCFNVDARNVAVGAEDGIIKIPFIDYGKKSSFGSLELKGSESNEDIGQAVNYESGYEVPLVRIDSLVPGPVDLIKIDVEGMEAEVVYGGKATLQKYHPVLFVEKIKSNLDGLANSLQALGYEIIDLGPNILAVYGGDPDIVEVSERAALFNS